MENMSVITFAATGHILGAVTRAAQADRPVAVDDVAPARIVIRDSQGAGLQASIDAAALQVVEVDYDTRVLYRPQLFAVSGGRAEQQIFNPLSLVNATLDGTTVSVNLPSIATGDTEVFVHVSGGALDEAAVRAVTVPENFSSGSESLLLGSGDYNIVIFAPGHATVLQNESIP
ncbi:MAG: hypothetical protein ACR2RB_10355 [Gammaproteobacteria bacterium]